MKSLLIFVLIAILASGASVAINDAAEYIIAKYCPFNDLYGPSYLCENITGVKFDSTFNPLSVGIGTGWDPIRGQIKLPFLFMTYDLNQTYITNGITYNVPDQITLTNLKNSNGEPFIQYTNYTFYTPFDLVNQMNFNRSYVESGILSQPPTQNNFLFDYFAGGQQYSVLMTEYRSNYLLENNTDILQIPIIPMVAAAIASLPAVYDADIYNLFIQYWGTHIVYSATAGGFAQEITTLKGCYEPGINLLDQIQLSLLKTIYPAEYQNEQLYPTYTEYTSATTIDMYGGDPTIVNPNNWSNRTMTFDEYPVLINVKVIPITEFISDPTIRMNLMTAIDAYFTGASDEIANSLTSWNTQWMGAQTVYAVPTFNGFMGSYTSFFQDTINTQVTINGNTTMELAHYADDYNDTFTWCYAAMKYALNNGVVDNLCLRDENGLILSNVDMTFWNKLKTCYPTLVISNVQNGSATRYGCSLATIYTDMPILSAFYTTFCCMGCTPTFSGSGDDLQAGWGAFSCECPAF